MIRKFRLLSIALCLILSTVINGYAQESVWTVTNIGGNGTASLIMGGNALDSGMEPPGPIDMDSEGNVYFACTNFASPGSSGIFKIEQGTNIITHILPAVNYIAGLAVAEDGKIYFCRGGDLTTNRYILIYNGLGLPLDTLAGNGEFGLPAENVDARLTSIGYASSLKIDPLGQFLYYVGPSSVGDANIIQKIRLSDRKTFRVAGLGGVPDASLPDGIEALLSRPKMGYGLAWDSQNNLYFGTGNNEIKKIKTDGTIWHVAGTGEAGYAGDGGPAADAKLTFGINGFVITSNDVMFLAETYNYDIRRIQLHPASSEIEIITRVCGTGFEEESGDNPGGDLSNGVFKLASETNVMPVDICLDGSDLIITDQKKRLRRMVNCTNPVISGVSYIQPDICKGDTIKMAFDGVLNDGTVWNWYKGGCQEGESLSNGTALTIVASESETYYAIGSGGCSLDNTCTEIKLEVGCKEYFNTFTPNNDGKNDFFEIPVLDNFPINTVIIYDRWGGELFTVENYDNSTNVWNGTNKNNDPLDAGTYYFTVVANGELITSGWVELIK